MGLINYKDIDFKIDKTNKIINFNNNEIRIINYLNVTDKYDLIMITLQKSFEDGIYNDFKLKQYFDLYTIYMYTNIVFTEEDRANELDILDTFYRSGLLALIKENIEELDALWGQLMWVKNTLTNYRNSLSVFLFEVLDELKEKATNGLELLNSLKPEDRVNLANLLGQTLNGKVDSE